jgi:hypothetical protein
MGQGVGQVEVECLVGAIKASDQRKLFKRNTGKRNLVFAWLSSQNTDFERLNRQREKEAYRLLLEIGVEVFQQD